MESSGSLPEVRPLPTELGAEEMLLELVAIADGLVRTNPNGLLRELAVFNGVSEDLLLLLALCTPFLCFFRGGPCDFRGKDCCTADGFDAVPNANVAGASDTDIS